MLTVTLQVDAPPGRAIGIKEHLAMYCERFGDTRVISIEEQKPREMEQMEIGTGADIHG